MTPGLIVVGGEALVDLVSRGDDDIVAHLGGGPFNCARTLGRLERPVAYLGRISSDRFGARLRDQLRADGVSLDAVVHTDDPTTLALAELDAAGAASYRFYVEGTSAPGLTPEAALSALPARVAAVHVGTLGLVFEPMADALEAVVMQADPTTLAMLDVNIRPPVIRDPAAYRARLARLLPRCHAVKASDDDLAWLDPDQGPVEAARTILDAGPTVVLLTRGAEGVTIVTPGGADDVPATPAEVVDTIGAGDAFGGGFLAWWSRNGLGPGELGRRDALLAATRFSALVAARTVERAGATPPRLAELPAD